MKRLPILAVALSLAAAACGSSSPAAPTTDASRPTFVATLSPANEVPPITNAESAISGFSTITLDTVKDGSGNITSATATFAVNLTGIPAGSSINIAHIHEGATSCVCPVVVNTTLAAGQASVSSGATLFQKEGISVTPEVAQRILANPGGFYFNVHSTLNPQGVARGVLVKQ